MQISDYPALSRLHSLPRDLSFERAIWGKVNGARSDFRWIARSQGFEGHRLGVEKSLVISSEERPQKCPFWRSSGNFYYAVSSYPSQAKDASGRSGFLEKQIIECRAESIPAALAALLLLPLVVTFQEELATSYTGDPRWDDPNFVLSGLQPCQCEVAEQPLLATIAKGRNDLKQFSNRELDLFYQKLDNRNTPAFLASDNPLTPEALAVLLVPFSPDRAAQLALGGWVPSTRAEAECLRNWDGIVCDSRLRAESVPPLDLDNGSSQGRRFVQLLRGLRPAVMRILDFAESTERWSNDIPQYLSELLDTPDSSKDDSVKDDELDQIKQAFQRVRQDSEHPSGLAPSLEEARQTQMRSKANIIRAAHLLLATGPIEEDLDPIDKDQLVRILQRWATESQRKLKSRIEQLLSRLQNVGLPG